ncbi:hypothetical protein V5N11_018829 [Cardamine amara subsp. amara]|uniref:Uncharacterized protein n=1 Tax=Cardamine amara subsp. amara TaxID=228776 RepID=A0ABD1A7J0_CARAN
MRRLPPWMLSGATTGERAARKSSEPEAPVTRAEKRLRRTVKPKEKTLELNSEKPKRVGRKIGEETKPSSCPVSGAVDDEDLTVDDLLSFAQEYVRAEEDQTREERESLSVSESMLVADESNMSSSQGGTRDSTTEDMLGLLLGPFFKKN